MLRSTTQQSYDFWVYVCPLDAEFSSRAAVKRMRDVAKDGVVPWGTIEMDDRPLIEQLTEASRRSVLPTTLNRILNSIEKINTREQKLYDEAIASAAAYQKYKE